jgi:hypothetical protein
VRDLAALDLRIDRLAGRAEEGRDLIGGKEKRERGERRCLRHVRPPAVVVARVAELRRGSGSGSGSGARTRETRRLRRTARATRRGRARTTRRGDRRGRRSANFEKPANRCPKARAVMARSRSLCSGSGAFSSKTSGAARISSAVARASSPSSRATRLAFATALRITLRRRARPQNPSSIVQVSSAQTTHASLPTSVPRSSEASRRRPRPTCKVTQVPDAGPAEARRSRSATATRRSASLLEAIDERSDAGHQFLAVAEVLRSAGPSKTVQLRNERSREDELAAEAPPEITEPQDDGGVNPLVDDDSHAVRAAVEGGEHAHGGLRINEARGDFRRVRRLAQSERKREYLGLVKPVPTVATDNGMELGALAPADPARVTPEDARCFRPRDPSSSGRSAHASTCMGATCHAAPSALIRRGKWTFRKPRAGLSARQGTMTSPLSPGPSDAGISATRRPKETQEDSPAERGAHCDGPSAARTLAPDLSSTRPPTCPRPPRICPSHPLRRVSRRDRMCG